MKEKTNFTLKRFIIKTFKNIARSIITSTELALFETLKYDTLLSNRSIEVNESATTIAKMHCEFTFKVNTRR